MSDVTPPIFWAQNFHRQRAPPTGVEVAGLFRDQIGGQDEEEQREEDTLAKQVVNGIMVIEPSFMVVLYNKIRI